ncbi:nucleotide sugar epimerase [Amylibacter marinus]|uniref:Nucleotide sugar epimerase n=2 Tax=Amylibacter marinus TaxID=1475483 RepID=A0ABQ5VXZ2_9RHOB|nr:nucleotide sugar epimerase [Amylibacter marinus]
MASLQEAAFLFPLLMAIGGVLVSFIGLPRIKLSAYENHGIVLSALASLSLAAMGLLVTAMFPVTIAKSTFVVFGGLFFIISVTARLVGQKILLLMFEDETIRKRVLVYGAGQAGGQLAAALAMTSEVKPVCFVDDDPALAGLIVGGLPVISARNIEKTITDRRIERVVVAIPSAPDSRRRELLRDLSDLPCEVLALPSFIDLLDGKQDLVESLKPISLDDLLGRDLVDLELPEVAQTYAGKSVVITGAGGSIGSELARQLLRCGIRHLTLFDHSEYALYSIERELSEVAHAAGIKLSARLGSVTDPVQVGNCFTTAEAEIVLHAAAYKHVPLVESNEAVGMYNNVHGTKVVADAALAHGLERFILVSTDKAVRPTNVMGSSKRLAELVIQDLASRHQTPLFSMVRFGNVLGSSGSVIPLFREQIERGGPVTVTHGDVTRFFMTIPEAARLVLLAGSYARGGDVFVLDMGAPVKIVDLAETMIRLSGRTLRNEQNPDGDIAVEITGLRPGEKLYEELLIGSDMLTTPHAKILRAQEEKLSELEVANFLRDLQVAAQTGDADAMRNIIMRHVAGHEIARASSDT